MPPATVKNVRDLIYWQYAKIIAVSAGFHKNDYGFVTSKLKQLREKEIFWNGIREYVKEKEKKDECIFCGAEADLTLEHLLPRHFNGPNEEKNVVWICRQCNSSKGAKRLYEYWVYKCGLKDGKNAVPRIAEGKYLKFAYEVLEKRALLGLEIDQVTAQICPRCDMKSLCIKEDTEGKLSVLCLDGMLTLCFKDGQG
jgi:hypothetical protein